MFLLSLQKINFIIKKIPYFKTISIFSSNQCFPQIGSRLEAADNNELMKIYPATVAGVHGRLLLIHYVQYEEEDDQIYDYRLALLYFYN